MSDPKRLVESEALGADLLREALTDAPSDAARHRVAVALGVASAAATAIATTTTAAAASTWGVSTSALVLLKALGLGVAGGAIAFGAVELAGKAFDEAPSVVATNVPTFPTRAPVGPPEAPTPAHYFPNLPQAVDSVMLATSAAVKAPSTPKATPFPSTSLEDEIKAMDRARTAFSLGDANGAIAALDAYDRVFSGGAFVLEAEVLRIEALAKRGDRATAALRAHAFLAAHPGAPHSRRVQSILQSLE